MKLIETTRCETSTIPVGPDTSLRPELVTMRGRKVMVARVARQLSSRLCVSAPIGPYSVVSQAGSKPSTYRPLTCFGCTGPSIFAFSPRRTVRLVGRPFDVRIARDTESKLGVCCVFTETIVSPGRSPIAWAGVPFSTCLTVVFRSPGAPIMYAMNGSARATRMLAPGPAKMTATRFQVRCRQ